MQGAVILAYLALGLWFLTQQVSRRNIVLQVWTPGCFLSPWLFIGATARLAYLIHWWALAAFGVGALLSGFVIGYYNAREGGWGFWERHELVLNASGVVCLLLSFVA